MTEVAITGRVGPDALQDGAQAKFRQGKSAEQIVQELHGRLFETNYRGALFSGGMALTSIANATFTTLTATTTPIAGCWNPPGSGVNLVIVQAALDVVTTAATSTGAAPFMWVLLVGNFAITIGNEPLNRSTLQLGGSKARDMTNVALTGLTNNLVARHVAGLGGGSTMAFSFVGTVVGLLSVNVPAIEYIEGAIIVPPGAVLALIASQTPVAHSAASMLLWEEVPV